jgi:glycosyltransferase involved in cell wall biosynthesis
MSLINILPSPSAEKLGWPWTIETSHELYNKEVVWPKISIVTPSYNQGKFIEKTIRSVLLQNYPNLEFIIIDGGSTDDTLEIIKQYSPWVSYWVSEKDKGQSHALNKGLEKCSGSIFNWLNSDDWYAPTTFLQIAKSFIDDKTLMVVSGYENHVFPDGKQTIYKGTLLQTSLEQTLEQCHISQPSTFFNLRSLRKIGFISEELHFLMDAEVWMRFLVINGQNNFLKLTEPVVNFRFHENSKTFNHINNKFIIERNSIMSSLLQTIHLPDYICSFLLKYIYECNEPKRLDIKWNFNTGEISKRKLRVYFIRRFINIHFQNNKPSEAYKGILELIRNNSIDFFVLKSLIKLVLK